MLRIALIFLAIALVAGLFGFPLLVSSYLEAAQLVFFVFIVLAILVLLVDLARGPRRGELR